MRVVFLLLATLACANGLIPRHLPTKLNRVVASSEVVAMKHAEQLSVAAAAFLLASTVASQPAFAGDIEAGSGIFSANCAACHAGGNNVIYSAKTLKKEALLEYLSGGYKESSIITQVTNGKNAMPAFGGRLSDEEIQDVAAFVFNQADTGAWDSR